MKIHHLAISYPLWIRSEAHVDVSMHSSQDGVDSSISKTVNAALVVMGLRTSQRSIAPVYTING